MEGGGGAVEVNRLHRFALGRWGASEGGREGGVAVRGGGGGHQRFR